MQDIIAIALVLAAVGYLAWRTWAMFSAKRKAGCGSCGSCPANGEPGVQAKPLVTINLQSNRGSASGTPNEPAAANGR